MDSSFRSEIGPRGTAEKSEVARRRLAGKSKFCVAGVRRTRRRDRFSEKKSFPPVRSARTRGSNESEPAQSQDAEPVARGNARQSSVLLFNLAGGRASAVAFGKNMHFRFKGYGYSVWFIVIGGFLIVRPLFETFGGGSEDAMRRHINGAVLAISGALTFFIATRADRKNGIEVFSKEAWTSDLMMSEHVCFNVPMRLFGVALLVISLFF